MYAAVAVAAACSISSSMYTAVCSNPKGESQDLPELLLAIFLRISMLARQKSPLLSTAAWTGGAGAAVRPGQGPA